jgi:acetylornithine deacetylase
MNPYISLLQTLIATPSFSKEESDTAAILVDFFEKKAIQTQRSGNNIWVKNQYWRDELPTILLNSHHDTVKPVSGWQRNPFEPDIENGQLFGLGSNDAGASLVGLIAAFLHFYAHKDLTFNLLFLASAEEEISGPGGISSVLPLLGPIDFGIVGEPTLLQMAIAEKGLLVIDAVAHGQAGHAAREEGINAIYIAMQDIEWLKIYAFERISPLLGKVKMSVTQIQAGTQHNVVPDTCSFVIDIRSNEHYTNQEIFNIVEQHLQSSIKARSFRLNSSGIALSHPLVQSGLALGLPYYGSPTLSDQALMPFDTLKIGIGNSARSHTADEFVYLEEIEKGIAVYIELLKGIKNLRP